MMTLEMLLPRGLRHHLWQRRTWRNINAGLASFPSRQAAPRHGLPGELIVSLTSYPARYPTLPNTLKSLLDQTVRPDRTILWIAEGHMPALTPEVLALRDYGLEILPCDDLKSHKKIIPALERFPDAFVVTADDDIFYWPDWLEGLVAAHDPAEPAVVCYNAHMIASDDRGQPRRYLDWPYLGTERATAPAKEVFPVGVAGILYPPGSLSPLVTDRELMGRLSLKSDDVWLFFMRYINDWAARQTTKPFVAIEWPNLGGLPQARFVATGDKDRCIAAMTEHFGIRFGRQRVP